MDLSAIVVLRTATNDAAIFRVFNVSLIFTLSEMEL